MLSFHHSKLKETLATIESQGPSQSHPASLCHSHGLCQCHLVNLVCPGVGRARSRVREEAGVRGSCERYLVPGAEVQQTEGGRTVGQGRKAQSTRGGHRGSSDPGPPADASPPHWSSSGDRWE